MSNLILSAQALLSKTLCIPEYQRAYTWGERNISKMVEDFEYFDNSNEEFYYLGTILLHHEASQNTYNIIDGQQRITTLLLLLRVVEYGVRMQDIIYENSKSQYRIYENYQFVQKLLSERAKIQEIFLRVFEKIRFTVIETANVDDAFTFFDTQNSRGVQPSVLVLLKSFHLRAITNDESRQKACAIQWEHHENHKNEKLSLSEESEKLEWLIKIFFYRVRHWRGEKSADFGAYESFRDGFTKELRQATHQEYKKYPSFMNQIEIDNTHEMIKKYKNSDWFAFAIRQPIYQGEGFFAFVDHYAKLLDALMLLDIYKGKRFHELVKVHKTGSRYIASFLMMVTLTYYERFGEDGMRKFVQYLDVLLTNIRLEQARILKQTMQIVFIRCENRHIKQNILDFICGAFDAHEVREWIATSEPLATYQTEGVQGRFSRQHKNFWGNEA